MVDAPIRILLFDDNNRIRDSLEILFASHPEFEWLGGYQDANDASVLVETFDPDVVLMDIDMPGLSGIEATTVIKKNFPDQVILMLTTFDDEEKIFAAICAGASGYLLKTQSLVHLIAGVKEAHTGGAPMTPSIAVKVLNLLQQKNAPANPDAFNLTDREKEVLKHLVNGDPYKGIADKMQISYDTVHSHIKHIYKKLHVNSVSEAVSKALRERL
ncbi:MAG: response regulator transcription factor [Chitinophagales bacterium]